MSSWREGNMTQKAIAVLADQVAQLYVDLDAMIAQERWAAAATYIGFYNDFLAQAKTLLPDLPLEPLSEPHQFPKGPALKGHFQQERSDREALLTLRPLCGQLKVRLRQEAD